MRLRELLAAGAGAGALGLLAFLWLSPEGLARAPDITVPAIDGRKIRLAELQGRPYIVTFWATTCPGCVREMPHLVELYEALHPRGFELIAIAMPYDPPNQVLEMARRRRLPYIVALDPRGEAVRAFGDVKLTPTSFLVAPDGRIVMHTIGEMDIAAVRRRIEAMLPAAPASG